MRWNFVKKKFSLVKYASRYILWIVRVKRIRDNNYHFFYITTIIYELAEESVIITGCALTFFFFARNARLWLFVTNEASQRASLSRRLACAEMNLCEWLVYTVCTGVYSRRSFANSTWKLVHKFPRWNGRFADRRCAWPTNYYIPSWITSATRRFADKATRFTLR